MRIMKVRLFVILLAIVILILSIFGIDRVMTPGEVRILEKTPTVSELDVYQSGVSMLYQDKKAIISLSDLMKDKVARIARNKNYEKYRNEAAALSFDYGYKGRPHFIDNEGRIVVAYRKFEFARGSWFFPYQVLYSDNSDILCYITDPDENVKILVSKIKNDMKI